MATLSDPGVYFTITEAEYHADPCPVPSLSSSIARVLYDESPFHARHWHPRLNPQPIEDKPDRPMDIGSAFHKFMLGKGRDVELVPFEDYKKRDARDARDAIRAAGKIPLLQSDAASVEVLNAAAVEQLADLGRGDIFTACDTEVTLVWREDNGVWCRARLDSLPKDAGDVPHLILSELKSTDGSADIDTWTGRYFANGYDIQAAFYRRGLFRLFPNLRTVTFEHVVLEQRPPNALNIVTASNQANEEADLIVGHTISLWGECMRTGQWPSYQPGGIVETTQWRSQRREMRNMALLDRMAKWQAP